MYRYIEPLSHVCKEVVMQLPLSTNLACRLLVSNFGPEKEVLREPYIILFWTCMIYINFNILIFHI